jgi:hypothetical protein
VTGEKNIVASSYFIRAAGRSDRTSLHDSKQEPQKSASILILSLTILCMSRLRCQPSSIMSLHQNTGSSTCVISPPIELQPISSHPTKPQDAKVTGLRLSDSKGFREDDSPSDLPSPTTHPAAKPEQWNHPRSNLFKTGAAFWSFVVMGSNDAAYGALIPYVST